MRNSPNKDIRGQAPCGLGSNMGQRGFSLIVAVFIIVILGFMGVMFLSMVNTASLSSVNDLQSAQAFSVAEGGVDFAQLALAQNLDWYRSATDPLSTTTLNLGPGSFTVSTTLPATELSAQVSAASTNPLRVYTVDRFPAAGGCVRIDNEYITYTGVGFNNAICSGQQPCFTGITRGAGACYGGGTQAAHSRGTAVYPAVTLTQAGGLTASSTTPFTIGENTKLLGAGTLDIEGEEIAYSASSLPSGGNITLTGIQRGMGGTTKAAHAFGAPVTPVLVGGGSASYSAEVVSTGTVGAGVRIVRKTIQR